MKRLFLILLAIMVIIQPLSIGDNMNIVYAESNADIDIDIDEIDEDKTAIIEEEEIIENEPEKEETKYEEIEENTDSSIKEETEKETKIKEEPISIDKDKDNKSSLKTVEEDIIEAPAKEKETPKTAKESSIETPVEDKTNEGKEKSENIKNEKDDIKPDKKYDDPAERDKLTKSQKESLVENLIKSMREETNKPMMFAMSMNALTTSKPIIEIRTAQQLSNMRNDLDGVYVLKNDINMSGVNWTPIGAANKPFTGELDGLGYKISNLNSSLFGTIRGAWVSNLGIANINNTNAMASSVAENAAGGSTIRRIYATGSLDGLVSGGLVIDLSGGSIIEDSYTNTEIDGMSSGGITTFISDSSRLLRTYAAGVTSGDMAGGLVSQRVSGFTGYITNSYWNRSRTSWDNGNSGAGKTTVELRKRTTFTGWDFTNNWTIQEGVAYPVFKSYAYIAPTISFAPNGTDWAKGYTTKIVSDRNGSRVGERVYINITESSTTPTTGVDNPEWTRIDSGVTLTLGSGLTGNHYVHTRTVSYFGNISNSRSDIAKLDNTLPTIGTSVSPGGVAYNKATVTATGFDVHSGIKRVRVQGGTWVNGSSVSTTALDNGIYSFEAEDNAGNLGTYSIIVDNIVTDRTAPTISISKNGGAYAMNHSTNITSTDTGSGIKSIQYQWTTSSVFPTSGIFTTIASGVSVSAPTTTGPKYLHVKATDNSDNTRNFTSAAFDIDRTAPLTPTIDAPSGWVTAGGTVSIAGRTDGHSGVARTEYRINNGAWTTYSSAITVNENGQTTIDARTIDNAGNISAIVSNTIKIDKVNPLLNMTQNITGSTNGNVIITATGTDAQSGVKRIRQGTGAWVNASSMTHTVTANGSYAFTVEDNSGRTVTQSATISNIDKTIPTISLSKNGGVYAKSHSTNITASDVASGLKSIQYQWTTSATFPTGGTFTTISSGGSVSAPTSTGNKYLHVRATDNANNIRNLTSSVYQIDNTIPSLSITSNTVSQTLDSITLTANGSDVHSGVKRVRVSGGSWVNGSSTSRSVSNNGTYSFEVEDKAGNLKTESIVVSNIITDITAPTVSLSKNGGAYSKNHSTVVTATDSESGVSLIEYQWSSSTEFPTSGNFTTILTGASINAPNASGNHYLHVRAKDVVGNTRSFTSNVFRIDITAPTAPAISANTNWSNVNVPITIIEGTDTHSGVAKIEYKVSGGAWTAYTESVSISTNGETVVNARTVDGAGNISIISSATIKIDKIKPAISIVPNTTATTHNNVTLTVSATDSGSSVDRINLPDGKSVNGGNATYTATSNGTYTFSSTDIAGNTETKSIVISNIDKTSSFTGPAILDFADTVLGDSTNTVTSSISDVKIKDWRDGSNKWRLDVSASKLKLKGESFYLPNGSVGIKPVSEINRISGSGTMPAKGDTDNNAIDDGQITVVEANGSRGEYDVLFPSDALELYIDPTTAKSGVYESTITWSFVSAP